MKNILLFLIFILIIIYSTYRVSGEDFYDNKFEIHSETPNSIDLSSEQSLHKLDVIPKYNFLSLHTVFILNENIKWLEEYIIYHIKLGFDHFYLYDNEGSTGGDGNKTTNKYDFSINTTSLEEDKILLNNILSKYRDYITYIIWQPKNEQGEIIYGQTESIEDCISKYGKYNEWMAFIDLDEFIFSKQNINLVDYLKSLDKNISNVKLIQKKFLDRFLTKEKFITQEFGCVEGLEIGVDWAPKNIIRCKDYLSINNIHNMYTKYETIIPDVDLLRFNHYNINEKQLNWMKWFYNSEKNFTINGNDDGMLRYKDIIQNIFDAKDTIGL